MELPLGFCPSLLEVNSSPGPVTCNVLALCFTKLACIVSLSHHVRLLLFLPDLARL